MSWLRGSSTGREGLRGLVAVAVACALLVAGCGSSGSGRASVNVLYAGSLENVMDKLIGPGFEKATGDSFAGYPSGSTDLASEIKGKVRQGDVFISASPSVNASLTGASNGNWVSWYASFGSSDLVLGYNPSSRFAAQLKHKPWYRVITEPGFRLGFTDPTLDPKGALTVATLKAAAGRYHDSALSRVAADKNDLFPEEDLVGRLQSGQLDAGFFYTVEASAAKIPTVSLGPGAGESVYTVTVLNRAAHAAAAEAFVKFLLGTKGRSLLSDAGLTLIPKPAEAGAGMPSSLSAVISPG